MTDPATIAAAAERYRAGDREYFRDGRAEEDAHILADYALATLAAPVPEEVRQACERLTSNSWETFIPDYLVGKRNWQEIADKILGDGRTAANFILTLAGGKSGTMNAAEQTR